MLEEEELRSVHEERSCGRPKEEKREDFICDRMYVLHLAICFLILLGIINYARSCYVVEIIDFMELFEVFLVNCGGNGFCVFF